MKKTIIYDLGANKGDNIAYYLKKADLVVTVEANPSLCALIASRFASEIRDGRLAVENCVLSDQSSGDVDFYLHKTNSELSQFHEPVGESRHMFDKVRVRSARMADLVARYGAPYYVKIDLEGCDGIVLNSLFADGIHPPYVSAEAHDVDVFCSLVVDGGYELFSVVEGSSVARKYGDHSIRVGSISERYAFPPRSAGPFGEDLKGPWMTRNDFIYYLARKKLGWIDIHATMRDGVDETRVETWASYKSRFRGTFLLEDIADLLPDFLRRKAFRLLKRIT